MSKKHWIGAMSVGIIFVALGILSYFQYRTYLSSYNARLDMICQIIDDKEPELAGDILVSIISENASPSKPKRDEIHKKWLSYGIDVDKDPILVELEKSLKIYIAIDAAVALFLGGLIFFFIVKSDKNQKNEIKRITRYLEQVNRGDYSFSMEDAREGESSILESEVYKTTIMLREAYEKSVADKMALKDALSDISHQLKTPLTSLSINIENLYSMLETAKASEAKLAEEEYAKQRKLIQSLDRDTDRISQMITQLLTLSRLDADVIEFDRKEASLVEIVNDAISDVEALADLKNIDIRLTKDEDVTTICDIYWETQAIGNILKNAIEHAKSAVAITVSDCKTYKEIVISNDGEPISDNDKKNLFTRFYRGESSGRESVGIGLSLAGVIVKRDKGYIIVESDEKKPESGTRFIIRF